ncbi:hypothetical protein OH799_00950 [Nocardia sp. NBC_00881]|uniref:hypothetical protein n=1 Tax=Nocardia sp. NBC_00881 TaxID=2975995 RepID=UPI00386841FC|nr:hypothetical protein OH799_00950 [Nocardia sp. NBC_00881]
MLAETDRRDPSARVMQRLEWVAESWGLDLERVFDAGSPRTQVLWELMEELERQGGGHLVVPSRAHLTGLGPSGRAVVQHVTRMPTAHIYYLDADLIATTSHRDTTPLVAGDQDKKVLVESRVGAVSIPARFDMIELLARQRWPELIEPVDKLYLELVEDADRAAGKAGDLGFGPGGNNGVIRLLHETNGLVVELEETRQRSDHPAEGLKALCQDVVRFLDRGRTVTRCTLPLACTPPRECAPPLESVHTASPGLAW